MGGTLDHLLSHLQAVSFNSSKCVVIAVSNKNIEEMDESIRQSGHFERDFYIPIPSSLKARKEILSIHFNRFFSNMNQILKQQFIDNLQRFTSGYVGKDIQRLFKMTQYHAENSGNTEVVWSDFEYALRVVKPSQLSVDNMFTIMKASEQETHKEFSDIGGYNEIKQRCKELLYWPLEHPESFQRYGLPTCCGILLHGPSGCGKTLLVKSLASMGKMNYISIKWYVLQIVF